jgi:hypothetical protein
MPTYTNSTRIHHLLSLYFADESLRFHSTHLHKFFLAAFAESDEDHQPNITRLLHQHNNLLRLLEAAHLLHQHATENPTAVNPNAWQHLKRIRAAVEDWDDFPSYLHSSEWSQPETVLAEFFAMQSVDEWKDVLHALLQSAIGQGSPFDVLTEMQMGFVVSGMHRVLDAVWIMWVTSLVLEEESCMIA